MQRQRTVLEKRRSALALRYALKIRSIPSHPSRDAPIRVQHGKAFRASRLQCLFLRNLLEPLQVIVTLMSILQHYTFVFLAPLDILYPSL